MERWNFYFKPTALAVSRTGATVELPTGHGMVTLDENATSEQVFFPAEQAAFELITGEVERLEKGGLAERHGTVR
ncbi:MAG: hypothetical protein ACTSQV_08860 [Alphaproteobacteria bacterium]